MKRVLSAIALLAVASLAFAAPPERSPRPALTDYETVRRAMEFSVGPVGFAAVTAPTETAFRHLLHSPTAAQDFRNLLSEATTVGQVYALLGLKLLNDPAYAAVASRYQGSRSKISVAGGCVTMPRPVAEIAKQIDNGAIE